MTLTYQGKLFAEYPDVVSVKPVSYTHLDVYKRQAPEENAPAASPQPKQGNSQPAPASALQRADQPATRDVYKRQPSRVSGSTRRNWSSSFGAATALRR